MPAAIINRPHREIVKALQMPNVIEHITAQDAEIVASSPKAIALFYEAEIRKWTDVVRRSGTKLEWQFLVTAIALIA